MPEAVLITGASGKLGRPLASHFSEKRYFIWLHYFKNEETCRETLDLIQSAGGNGALVQADLRKSSDIQRMFQTIDQTQPLSLLINSASVFVKSKLNEINLDSWDEIFDVNLKAVWMCSAAAAESMKRNGAKNGAIINVSDSGAYQDWVNYGAYSLSKAAVQRLTVLLAKTFAPDVRVNSISPGLILSDPSQADEGWDRIVRKSLLGRSGTVQNFIEGVAFLAESEYVTGIDLPVDGGYRWQK